MAPQDSDNPAPIAETIAASSATHDESKSAGRSNPQNAFSFGDYEVEGEIARGGMGVVYRARDRKLDRMVALKMIKQAELANEVDRQRFKLEAEAAARLDHPNTVAIYNVDEFQSQPFYTMRLIDGSSLGQRLLRERWPAHTQAGLESAVRLLLQVAEAVDNAHKHGIIHRDLKPGNILLDENDTAYVTDFGLAKRVESNTELTQTGELMGTPAYMAPEQATGGKQITVATDVYSLGAILYCLLAGRPPFEAESPLELIDKVMHATPASLRTGNPQVDRDLETICLKCLEKEPSRRYTSVRALIEDLNRWQRAEPIVARKIGYLARSMRWARRSPGKVVVLVVGLVLTAMIFGSLYLGYRSTQQVLADIAIVRYASAMREAADALEDGSQSRLQSELRKGRQVQTRELEPGWEWNYLFRKSPIELSLPIVSWASPKTAWSPDGSAFAFSRVDWSGRTRSVLIWEHKGAAGTALTESRVHEFLRSICQRAPNSQFQVHFSGRPGEFAPSVEWSPDGQYLAVYTLSGIVHIWDRQSRSIAATMNFSPANNEVMRKLTWSSNSKRLAITIDDRVYTLSIAPSKGKTGVNRSTFPLMETDGLKVTVDWSKTLDDARDVHWVANDTLLAVRAKQETLFINATDGSEVKRWPHSVLAWNRDGSRWAGRSGIGSVDSPDAQMEVKLPGNVLWSPDSERLACEQGSDIVTYDCQSRRWLPKVQLPYAVQTLTWLPTSNRLMEGGKLLRPVDHDPQDKVVTLDKSVQQIVVATGGQHAAVKFEEDDEVAIVNSTGQVLQVIPVDSESPIVTQTWSPRGDRLATLNLSGIVAIHTFSADFGQVSTETLGHINVPAKPVASSSWQLHWSPDGAYLGGSAADTELRVWSMEDKSEKWSYSGPDVRAIGWTNQPMNFVCQLGSNSMIMPRQRSTAPRIGSYNQLVHWQPSGETFCYTIRAYFDATKIPRIDQQSKQLISFSYQGTLVNLEFPGAPTENSMLPVSFPDKATTIGQIDYPTRLMHRGEKRGISITAGDSDRVLLRLADVSNKAVADEAGGWLWIADGKALRILDGRPSAFSMDEPDSVMIGSTEAFKSIALTVLFSIPLSVIWIMVDRGIRMRFIMRWMTALTVAFSLWTAAHYVSPPHWLRDVWSLPIPTMFKVYQLQLMSGLLLAGYVAELIRLWTRREYFVVLGCVSLVIAFPIAIGFIRQWPSVGSTATNSDMMALISQAILLLTSLFMLVARAVMVFNKGQRGDAYRWWIAPLWVRVAVYGVKNMGELWLAIAVMLGLLILFVFGIGWFYYRQVYFLAQLTGILCVVLLSSTVHTALAIRWILAHGGWNNIPRRK